MMDFKEHIDQGRDEQDDNPGSVDEFGDEDDDDDAGRDQGTEAVDDGKEAPVSFPALSPVDDHGRLGNGEGEEYADGIEGNEVLNITLEEDNQDAGHERQDLDAVRIAQAFTSVGKVAGDVAVDGHERKKRRQAVVGRIGGDVEDDHHQNLDDVVNQGPAEDIFDKEGQ